MGFFNTNEIVRDVYRSVYSTLARNTDWGEDLLVRPDDAINVLLGTGMFGMVFATRDPERVLKITSELTELFLSQLVKDHPRRYRGFARVYDAKFVKLTEKAWRTAAQHSVGAWGRYYKGDREDQYVSVGKFNYPRWVSDHPGDLPLASPTHMVAILREALVEIDDLELENDDFVRAQDIYEWKMDFKARQIVLWSSRLGRHVKEIATGDWPGRGVSLFRCPEVARVLASLRAIQPTNPLKWFSQGVLALHKQNVGITDTNMNNFAFTRRSLAAGQLVLFDLGLSWSAQESDMPEALRGLSPVWDVR